MCFPNAPQGGFSSPRESRPFPFSEYRLSDMVQIDVALTKFLHAGVAPTLEEHRNNLERYRALLAAMRDPAVREMLKRLIAETRRRFATWTALSAPEFLHRERDPRFDKKRDASF